MLNNEFRLIGTIVSDWEKVGSDNFPKYEMKIEVERRKKDHTSVYTLVAYEKNYVIDVTKSLKGKTVIVTGYLDLFKDFIKLVMQDIVIVGSGKSKITVVTNEEPVKEEPVVEMPIIENDDLPF